MAGSAAPRATGPAYDKIVETLERLEDDQTLLVQSGKPVGVFRTHKDAPRVLIANSNLVPKWATWEKFNELDRAGPDDVRPDDRGQLDLHRHARASSKARYETFAEMGRQHYGGDLKGKWILTAGLGGMGGAQPLAAVMAGAHCIAVEVQESRIEKRLETRYLDHRATSIDEALDIIAEATEPTSVGLLGNAAEILPEMVARGIRPDAVTDQTSAHDPANGYCPAGWSVAKWQEMRERDPQRSPPPRAHRWPAMSRRCSPSRRWASRPSIMATTSARKRSTTGVTHAFDFPGFVPAYVRPLFCRGIGPFRWVALSGDPEDIYKTDQRVKELIPDDPHLHRWLDMARERIAFQGLPARICWVGLGQRHRLGLAFNEMVRNGEVSAPIVIGRDHLDSGSVASPNRETEAMKDGSDAVSDWPLLNALLNTASGRDLGLAPPRRRGRHGLFAARRDGDRRRRHRRCRAPPRTRAVERPRHRRHAPRRRGL